MRLPLTVEWEDVGRVAGNFSLKVLEYFFKLFALLAAGIAMSTPGPFSEKIGSAFSGLSQALRQTVALPGELMDMGRIIRDYNIQSASDFTATYGTDAVGSLLFDLNYVVDYAGSVYNNLTGSFFATAGAVILAFLAFYILATVLRFARQKGQGSYLVQFERKLGDRIFFKKPVVAAASSSQASASSLARSAKKPVSGMRPRTNSFGFPTRMMRSEPSGRKPAGSNLVSATSPSPGPRQTKPDSGSEEGPPQSLSGILKSARSSE